ncbi:MAG: hypothetical protein GX575_29475 [Candidatus Anammoximicrobium sp.]|nr:hypothetical protein [Candidatus Anammoximicrobium sp.]
MSEQSTPEVIEPGRLYSKAEINQRLRLGPKGWRSLVRSGLPVVRLGRGSFVFTDDLLAAIRRQQQEAASCE